MAVVLPHLQKLVRLQCLDPTIYNGPDLKIQDQLLRGLASSLSQTNLALVWIQLGFAVADRTKGAEWTFTDVVAWSACLHTTG